MTWLNNIYSLTKYALLPLLVAFCMVLPLQGQTKDDIIVTHTETNGQCENDAQILVSVKAKTDIYTISKIKYKFFNEETDAEITIQSDEKGLAAALYPGSYRVNIKVLFDNGVEVNTSLEHLTVTTTYKAPSIAITKNRPTLKNYPDPTGIIGVKVSNGSASTYTAKLISVPSSYDRPLPSITITRGSDGYFYNLPAGEYKVQVNDQCISYPAQKVIVETTEDENPERIADNDVVYDRSQCGHCEVWRIGTTYGSTDERHSYIYPTDTLAKYYDVAIVSEEEFQAKGVTGITWYNLKELPKDLDDTHSIAFDPTSSYSGLKFRLTDSWYNTGRLPSNQRPSLYLKQRKNTNPVPEKYSLDYHHSSQWVYTTPPPANEDLPCALPTGKTTIRMSNSDYSADFCPPLQVEIKKGKTKLAEETLTLDEPSKEVEFEYESNTTYTITSTDSNGDQYVTEISIGNLWTYDSYTTTNFFNYCEGYRNISNIHLTLNSYSNVVLPYKKDWKNFTITLKKAPDDYVPLEGSIKVGESKKIENVTGTTYSPFAQGQKYSGSGSFVFGIRTPCGDTIPDEKVDLPAIDTYSIGGDFAPKVDTEKCGYIRVYPFPNGIGNILLKNGKPLEGNELLSVGMTGFSSTLIPSSSIKTFNGSSTLTGYSYVSFYASDASKVYFEFPSVKTTVTYKLYNDTYAYYFRHLESEECYPVATVNLANANVGFDRDSFVGYACPNGLSGFIAFQPTNYVGTLHVELRPISGKGDPFYKNENLTVKKGDFVEINLQSKDGVTPIPNEYLLYLKDNECLNDNKDGVGIVLNDLSSRSIVRTTQRQTKYCEGDPILLESVSLGGKVTYEWTLPNGETLTGRKCPIKKSEAAKHSGNYVLKATNVICEGAPLTVEIPFILSVAPPEMWWASDAKDANWNSFDNWCNAEGVHIKALPAHCTTVHLPATVASHFPDLDPSITDIEYWGRAECDNIYFHYGSQLGLPQRLSYNRAFIDYNFGKENGGTITAYQRPYHPGSDALLLNRNQWYMLSTPIKNVLSGDFSLGGYPKTYQKYLKVDLVGDPALTDASFDAPINSLTKNLSQYDNAIAYKVVGYNASTVGNKDHKNLNGLNGIVEVPYYLNSAVDAFYPLHKYVKGTSYFRYYSESTLSPLQRVDKVSRSEGNDFRFIFEKTGGKSIGAITVNGKNVEGYSMPFSRELDSDIRMIGNPFMTAIDFDKLYEVNKNLIEPYYYLNNNNTWIVYHKNVTTSNQLSNAIPALQAFVVKKKSVSGNLLFPTMGDDNVLLPPNKQTILRSDNLSDEKTFDNDMLISVVADNAAGKGTEAILLPASSIVSAPALIYSGNVDRPIIYFVDSVASTPNAIHAGNNKAVVPMGVYCENAGPVRLHFRIEQQNTFNKLTLYDRLTHQEQDLLSMPYYEFNHGFTDGYRFELRMDYPGVSANLATESIDTSFSVERLVRGGYKVSTGKGIVGYVLYSMEGKTLSDRSYSSSIHELILENEDFSAPRILVVRLIDGSSETIKLSAI